MVSVLSSLLYHQSNRWIALTLTASAKKNSLGSEVASPLKQEKKGQKPLEPLELPGSLREHPLPS